MIGYLIALGALYLVGKSKAPVSASTTQMLSTGSTGRQWSIGTVTDNPAPWIIDSPAVLAANQEGGPSLISAGAGGGVAAPTGSGGTLSSGGTGGGATGGGTGGKGSLL